jgi:phosphodiesterase/alkaline phosphatase D-like protein
LGWGFTLNVQGYRDLLSSTGMYFTLDDHEVVDSDTFDPEMLDGAKLSAALDTMVQNLAIERGPGGETWGSHQWGQTVEVIVTDLRTERRPSTRETADPIFVSPEQLAFVKDRLMNTTAHFKLVFSSVNMANLPTEPGWDIPFAYADRWEGYGAQREELLDFIVDNGIDDVYFIAGDIHVGFVGRLEPEGTSPYARMWEITVGPGASGDNPLGSLLEAGVLGINDVFPCNQFVFGHGRRQVATTLELDPLADTLRVRFVDGVTEEVLFDEVLQQEP